LDQLWPTPSLIGDFDTDRSIVRRQHHLDQPAPMYHGVGDQFAHSERQRFDLVTVSPRLQVRPDHPPCPADLGGVGAEEMAH
jgi:hypothetical protein